MPSVRVPFPLPFFYTPHKSQTKRNLCISPCTKGSCRIYPLNIRSHKNNYFSEIIPFGSQILSFSVSRHKTGHKSKSSFKSLKINNLSPRSALRQNFPSLRLCKRTVQIICKPQTPDTKLSSIQFPRHSDYASEQVQLPDYKVIL